MLRCEGPDERLDAGQVSGDGATFPPRVGKPAERAEAGERGTPLDCLAATGQSEIRVGQHQRSTAGRRGLPLPGIEPQRCRWGDEKLVARGNRLGVWLRSESVEGQVVKRTIGHEDRPGDLRR